MSTETIGRGDWGTFFDEFSRTHERRPTTVEVLGELGAQAVAEDLPLLGIVADEPSHGGAVSILLGRGEETFTHTVARPARVEIERGETGDETALEIEAADGERTLLHVR